MWNIQRTLNGTWRITTEAYLHEDWYDATGEYATKQHAIEAATLHGDEYVVLLSEQSEQKTKDK